MQTDEWRAIEADPIFKGASAAKKAAMRQIYEHAVAQREPAPAPALRPTPSPAPAPVSPGAKEYPGQRQPRPLVTTDRRDPPRASLLDEFKAAMPEAPNEHPTDRAARERRLARPPADDGLSRFVRTARERIPAAAQQGLTSGLVADVHAGNQQGVMMRRHQPEAIQPPLVVPGARNLAPESGLLDSMKSAASDVRREPGRLLPGSPGFSEGLGAAVPDAAFTMLDPAGDLLLGGGITGAAKLAVMGARKAAPVVRGAVGPAGDVLARAANRAAPMARQLLKDESGQWAPGPTIDALRRGLDNADNAFEAAGQATMAGARRAGTAGMAAMNTAAARAADPGQRLGDLLHRPKAAAEDAASAAARVVDLPGRTGRTAAEWYEAAKHNDANTGRGLPDAILNGVRKAFVSDYGMTPEMKAIREEGRVFGENTARPLEELAVQMNRDRTGAQQHDVHWQATEKTPPPGPLDPQTILDAIAVKRVSRDADQALESVGALPQGLAAEYDGSHLPRGYTKHWFAEGKKNPFGQAVDNKLGGFYRRGLDETMSADELRARQASAATTGEDWKLVRTHADGVTVDAHRDWTIPERQAWGEIRHVGSALQRKAAKTRHEASAAYVQNAYAQPGAGDRKGAFAVPASTFGPGAQPATREIGGQKFVLLDGRTAKQSGIPKYGRLANHYVRDDVAFHLWNQNELKPFINKINTFTLNNLWKKMVTLGNFPGYFVNNFFQNPLILERAGGTMADMPAAWSELAHNSLDVQRLEEAGVIRNGVLARELGAQLAHFNDTLSSHHMHSGFTVSKQIFRAMNALKAYEQNGYKLAGASDDLYRVALVQGLMRREGKTFEEAAAIAKDAFYDADAVTAPAAQVASVIAPFAKVFWWAADNEAKAWVHNPGKTAYMNFLIYALPKATAYALGKSASQQDAEELAKYPHMQGHGNSFPLPYTDSEGQPYYLDTSAWNLYNQFKAVDNTGMSARLPVDLPIVGGSVGLPRGLSPGGVPATLAQLWANKEVFTGRDLVKRDADGHTIEDLRGDFLQRNLMPGVVRNGAALYGAATGSTTPLGNRVSPLAKALRVATGIKANPVNVGKAIRRNANERDRNERDFNSEIRDRLGKAQRARDEGSIRAAERLEQEARDLAATRDQMIQAAQDRDRRLNAGGAP